MAELVVVDKQLQVIDSDEPEQDIVIVPEPALNVTPETGDYTTVVVMGDTFERQSIPWERDA